MSNFKVKDRVWCKYYPFNIKEGVVINTKDRERRCLPVRVQFDEFQDTFTLHGLVWPGDPLPALHHIEESYE